MATKRLDIFLFETGYYDSRARAASAIKTGHVKVNGRTATKASAKVSEKDDVQAEAEHPWVSRGGMKLAHALEVFDVDPTDQVCLDVGASTGGFTQVLITNGAARVYAVDVGRDQLHHSLRDNFKIVSMEATDARGLTSELFQPIPTLIVCDASFISAGKVLETPLRLVEAGAVLITLVKPQFEVGKDHIGRGGLVKDRRVAEQSLKSFADWLSAQGWAILATDISPVKGGDGNTEFLLYARKT